MTIELPVLRLGLAGFTADEQLAVRRVLRLAGGEATHWEAGDIDGADAWWVSGARLQLVGTDRIRIAPAIPSERAVQFHMPDIDRPLAFARPLPAGFQALCSFDANDRASMGAVLQQFEGWLAPLVAQFCLASHIVEHQSALGSGQFELRLNSELLAVVDMHGAAAVRATARPEDFDGALWRRSQGCIVPEAFVRTSLSELMWQFAVRTQRDVLPRHYRTGLLYFRRAPRVPQRLLKDAHLLLMRELMLEPATFEGLQQRCGFEEQRLARELSALYLVGSITSNPKRAARAGARRADGDPASSLSSNLPSGLDSALPASLPRKPRMPRHDLTAPAPLRFDH